MAVIRGLMSLSFKPHPTSDNNSRLQGFVGINMSDSPSMPFKVSVPESLMPSNVEEIGKKSGVVMVMSLERSTMLEGVILHFFKSNDFSFFSSGSFSISTAMLSAAFNEKSKTDKAQLWPARTHVKLLVVHKHCFETNIKILAIVETKTEPGAEKEAIHLQCHAPNTFVPT